MRFRKKDDCNILICSENKDADQLHGYPTADLCLCFHIYKNRFHHDVAQLILE